MTNDAQAQPTATPRRKRWRRLLIAAAILLAVLWWAGVRVFYFAWISAVGTQSAQHTDYSQLSRVIPPRDTTLAVIHRGLPHQMWKRDKLWRDLFLTSNRSIGGYRFYTTPAAAPDSVRASVAAALQDPMLFQPYRGPKACGGYHPDYCFELHHLTHGTFYALLCTGCHEIILIGDGAEVHCDLRSEPAKALESLLATLNE